MFFWGSDPPSQSWIYIYILVAYTDFFSEEGFSPYTPVCEPLVLSPYQQIFIVKCFGVLELKLDPERHTQENIPYVELDDETYKKWKEEKKKSMKKNQDKCCCD